MLRRSRIFRHMFLDVASHPNLIFRSFIKILRQVRVDITDQLRREDRLSLPQGFAVPRQYTVFLNDDDYDALTALGERTVAGQLEAEFRRFLQTPAGRLYDVPSNQDVTFRLEPDAQVGVEPNEYYFAWQRESMPGVVGWFDLYVRGDMVERIDVPEVPSLGVGTTRDEQVRLDLMTDRDVYLPARVSVRFTWQDDRLMMVNRSDPAMPILLNGRRVETDGLEPVRVGSRIGLGPDVILEYEPEPAADRCRTGDPVLTESDLEDVLGLIRKHAAPTRVDHIAAASDESGSTAPDRLEVVGTVLTAQMFDHAPDGVLSLGSSPRCHIVLRGKGIRPVHAELTCADGRFYVGNRSGRRAVHVGVLDVPVRPGSRHPVNPGDPIRIGHLLMYLEPPSPVVGSRMGGYFGGNYLGNLVFERPQANLVLNHDDSRPIVIGRADAMARRGAVAGSVGGDGLAGDIAPVREWRLASPYLWPRHAEIVMDDVPSIQPYRDPTHGCRSALFVNMSTVLTKDQCHPLTTGDRLILGNLIVHCAG